MNRDTLNNLLLSRYRLAQELAPSAPVNKCEEEGGCGVVGFCCTEAVPAKHIYEPSRQMHNRGNGKGGGIAALGFVPEQLGVSRDVLDNYYMLHVAFLDPLVRPELEGKYITTQFDIAASGKLETVDDWTSVENLEAKPPDVWRYFVRVKQDVLDSFKAGNGLVNLSRDEAESEFINQNSIRLNQEYYASLGEQKAFVLSQGKNIMILKVVGYAEAITRYYKIEDLRAHVWIAHQRFPTKGRVWHPAGAHPFGAVNTALVHNGDFANYHSVSEYLAERHIFPQFLTDTEVSVLLFDLLDRTYHYPLEYIIEAMAPTSELDFDRLPDEKQQIYRAIQSAHIHGSPDGPWFFIIARSFQEKSQFQLMGITDTAMLRPQVFAFSDGEVQVGLICSEKQAIDATLLSLHHDDKRICPVADRYWNARGGSHTDGGAFIFNLQKDSSGKMRMTCTDKFGIPVPMPRGNEAFDFSQTIKACNGNIRNRIQQFVDNGDATALFEYISSSIHGWTYDDFSGACAVINELAQDPKNTAMAIKVLSLLNDRKYPAGSKKTNHIVYIVREALRQLLNNITNIDAETSESKFRLIDYETRGRLRPPGHGETTLVINTRGFAPEGEDCDATLLMDGYLKGWRHFICYNCSGQRFTGCGLGPETKGVTIDVYDSSGDYLGSGIDGLEINVHGNAQDQIGQITKNGKLVVHGDVGQTFMYGAKGGAVYIMGNAAGRPLINSVGKPRVVINGTCLDFLAESFMAGDIYNGGGFVILNGITFNDDGRIVPQREPYPGSNLFSLASGGAIFIRDPKHEIVPQQLNGGTFKELTGEDWELILPYLEENERLFGIKVEDLLTVDGIRRLPAEVYRKVAPVSLAALGPKKTSSPNESKLSSAPAGK
jgi:glutamate synthase domain-containing protein 1/glutamate synthase domain-containing protein 3